MRVLLNAVFLLILALEGVAVISVVLWRWWWWCSCIIGSWSTGMASASLTFCCIWDAGKKYEVSSRTKLWRVHLKVISKGSWIVLFWVFLVLVFCSVGVRCHKKSIHWEVIYRLKKKKKKDGPEGQCTMCWSAFNTSACTNLLATIFNDINSTYAWHALGERRM